MTKSDFTADHLRQLLHYDTDTGVFTWLVNRRVRRMGDIAGTPHSGGYLQISIDGRLYMAHRLAWLYVYGQWPVGYIDHRDGVRTNNIFSNLRNVTNSVNMQNQKRANKDNKTGLLGVSPSQGKFRAFIGIAGKSVYLGYFDTPELAHAAYLAAKREHHEGNTL